MTLPGDLGERPGRIRTASGAPSAIPTSPSGVAVTASKRSMTLSLRSRPVDLGHSSRLPITCEVRGRGGTGRAAVARPGERPECAVPAELRGR